MSKLNSAQRDRVMALIQSLPAKHRQALLAALSSGAKDSDALMALVENAMASLASEEKAASEQRKAKALAPVRPLASPSNASWGAGRLTEAGLEAFWAWAVRDLAGEPEDDPSEWQRRAAAGAQHAIADKARRKALLKKLGSEARVAEAEHIAAILTVGPEINAFFADWGDLVQELNDGLVDQVRVLHDRLVEIAPDVAPLLLILVARRLRQPHQVLRALKRCTKQSSDRVITKTDMKLVGDTLIDDLDEWLTQLELPRRGLIDVDGTLAALKSIMVRTIGMTREFEIQKDGAWGVRISRARAEAARRMEKICGQLNTELEQGLPIVRRRGARNAPRIVQPDLDVEPNPETIARTTSFAQLVRASSALGAQGGYSNAVNQALADAETYITDYVDELVRVARGTDQDGFEAAQIWFEPVVQVALAAGGEQFGDLARRRFRAASPEDLSERVNLAVNG
ncbi:MAG: hypothetical protein ACFB2Z_02625 [Maricaulaceae bacterium]